MQPAGQAALRQILDLHVPPSAVESYITPAVRKTEITNQRIREYYPKVLSPEGSVVSHIKFALKHEPIDLGVLVATFKAMNPDDLVDWSRKEPTGAYSRRAWFLYETFTGRTLDLPPVKLGNYAYALNPAWHFTAGERRSPKHRVIDNLLGGRAYCPIVRRTPQLEAAIDGNLAAKARALTELYDPDILARAVSYLYTKETRSSFAIEGETPSVPRTQRFVAVLRAAADFDPTSKPDLARLQSQIVDPRYAESDWRSIQNFVGEIISGYQDGIHFVTPKPENVADLMAGWMGMTARLRDSELDPVVAAALISFGFVFIHPFNDGNGRIHRFLLHNVLMRRGFSPPDLLFPISASILRQRHAYDAALETFSKPRLEFTDYRLTHDYGILVENDTVDLYRYFDATRIAEYLYERVADTIHHDLREELDFVTIYDRAVSEIGKIVDMPDRRVSLLARLCLQNRGHLAKSRRTQFAELSDDELSRMESAINEAIASVRRGDTLTMPVDEVRDVTDHPDA